MLVRESERKWRIGQRARESMRKREISVNENKVIVKLGEV